MEVPVISPDPGVRDLTPKQALRWFEFFRPGCHRCAILLGDLVEQRVHYIRSKNHKVLCGRSVGASGLVEPSIRIGSMRFVPSSSRARLTCS